MITRIPATFTGVENGMAIFLLAEGQKIMVAKEECSPLPIEGTPYVIQIMTEAEAKLDQEALSRTLLNQILHDDSRTT